MKRMLRINGSARVLAVALALFTTWALASNAFAHEVTILGDIEESQVVHPDGSTGTGSTATGEADVITAHDPEVLDIVLRVDGIFPEDLDESHGPNATAIHINMADPGLNGPILVDVGWFIREGFGTMTATPTGFELEISSFYFPQQGNYNVETATGLTTRDIVRLQMNVGHSYVQIYTFGYPDGEIRGQLVRPANEACCFPDGTCGNRVPVRCVEEGGTPRGAGTACATTSCPPPPPPNEACCFVDGSCQDLDATACAAAGGIAQGPGSSCATANCPPPPTEACCFADGTCQDLTVGACVDAGGVAQGSGSNCATADCPQPPNATEPKTWGAIKAQHSDR